MGNLESIRRGIKRRWEDEEEDEEEEGRETRRKKRRRCGKEEEEEEDGEGKKLKLTSTINYNYKNLFLNGDSSDVTLEAFGKNWPLHKIFLSKIDYFKNMLAGNWNESKKNKIKLFFLDPYITQYSFEKIIESLYTDEVIITMNQASSILATASYFAMDELIHLTCTFLEENLSYEKITETIEIAELYGRVQLKAKCVQFLARNILLKTSVFNLKNLNVDTLNEILICENFFVLNHEASIYKLLKKWFYLQLYPGFQGNLQQLQTESDIFFKSLSKWQRSPSCFTKSLLKLTKDDSSSSSSSSFPDSQFSLSSSSSTPPLSSSISSNGYFSSPPSSSSSSSVPLLSTIKLSQPMPQIPVINKHLDIPLQQISRQSNLSSPLHLTPSHSSQSFSSSSLLLPHLSYSQINNYLKIFNNLKLDHAISCNKFCYSVHDDSIIPPSWLLKAYHKQWLNLNKFYNKLFIENNKLSGEEEIENNFFEKISLRFGRIFYNDDEYFWRWTGFEYYCNFVFWWKENTLRLKCPYIKIRPTLLTFPPLLFIRLELFSLNEEGRVDFIYKSSLLEIPIDDEEDPLIISLKDYIGISYPLYLSCRMMPNFMFFGDEEEEEEKKEKEEEKEKQYIISSGIEKDEERKEERNKVEEIKGVEGGFEEEDGMMDERIKLKMNKNEDNNNKLLYNNNDNYSFLTHYNQIRALSSSKSNPPQFSSLSTQSIPPFPISFSCSSASISTPIIFSPSFSSSSNPSFFFSSASSSSSSFLSKSHSTPYCSLVKSNQKFKIITSINNNNNVILVSTITNNTNNTINTNNTPITTNNMTNTITNDVTIDISTISTISTSSSSSNNNNNNNYYYDNNNDNNNSTNSLLYSKPVLLLITSNNINNNNTKTINSKENIYNNNNNFNNFSTYSKNENIISINNTVSIVTNDDDKLINSSLKSFPNSSFSQNSLNSSTFFSFSKNFSSSVVPPIPSSLSQSSSSSSYSIFSNFISPQKLYNLNLNNFYSRLNNNINNYTINNKKDLNINNNEDKAEDEDEEEKDDSEKNEKN